jgi:hypothetical protein
MTTIPTQTKDLLLRLCERIPPLKRDAFVTNINARLSELGQSNTVYYTLLGGITGYLLGHVPLVGFFTQDHETEIGLAVGAWVGIARDHEERKRRETIQSIVGEALRHALA